MAASRTFGRYWFGAVGPSGYGFHTTAEQVAADNADAIRGKVVLVTGAASGIGFETARVFAKFGATVFVTARSTEKATKAADAIRALVPEGSIKTLAVDLSNLKDVKRAADEFIALKSPLHILVNNAGVMATPFELTADGIEMQFGTNHVGHFVLTMLLLPVLKASAPARVVNVASMGHFFCGRDGVVYPGPLDAKATYSSSVAYGRSKLANIQFARGLNARYAQDGVTAYSLHPGNIKTELARHYGGFLVSISGVFLSAIGKTIPEGAATSLFCAVSPKAVAGEYHDESNVDTEGFHPKFNDKAQVDQLWTISEKIMAEKLDK